MPRRKTDEEFKKEVYDLVGNEYTFLDTYVNSYTKIKVKHNKCGLVYEVQPNAFLHNSRCPYCAYENYRKTDDEFKQEIYDLVGNEYVFLDSYVNNRTRIRVKHNKCGNVYKTTPGNFIHGNRCPYCSITGRKTDAEFKQEVFALIGDEYAFLDTYVNSRTKIRVKHNKCGHIYKVEPNSFIHGSRCPYCNSPKGETIIIKILETLDINYEYQKTFDDLKDVQPLSYDFYVQDQRLLIEYQGEQHYRPKDLWGGDDKFKIQQKHDKMKSDYAKFHNYKLITIPYKEDTFPKIKNYLLQHGLAK